MDSGLLFKVIPKRLDDLVAKDIANTINVLAQDVYRASKDEVSYAWFEHQLKLNTEKLVKVSPKDFFILEVNHGNDD